MATPLPRKQLVIDVGISKTSYTQVVALCKHWWEIRKTNPLAKAHYICVTSVHGVMMAHDDPEMAAILNAADIATPDGMPLVWALRSLGEPGQQRVYGPTLMLEICREAALSGARVFLYGGREEVLPILITRLKRMFPNLCLTGSYSPPFRHLQQSEEALVRQLIRSANPDVIFVGISTPKQEKWMHDHLDALPGVTMIGVGAAFDFHAGSTRQAPSWMQRNGLEWFFRLSVEPRRLWRRYLLVTPRFLPLWIMQRIGMRRSSRKR